MLDQMPMAQIPDQAAGLNGQQNLAASNLSDQIG
jgi:hypothetical protein